MAILKKIVNILSNISFILLILYALVASPLLFGYHPVVILSGSMTPSYKVGDIAYYHQVSEEELKEGDVIAFKNDSDVVVAHRLNSINTESKTYETKGDANDTPDGEEITYDNILGKIMNIKIPIVGYYIWFVNKHIYVVGIMIFLIALDFIIDIVDKKKKKN